MEDVSATQTTGESVAVHPITGAPFTASPAGVPEPKNMLIVGGRQETRDGRRRQEDEASNSLVIAKTMLTNEDGTRVRSGLLGIITATTLNPGLRFAEDWSLFSAISKALIREHGFWCARVPRNSQEFVALHQPEEFFVAVDPLQMCRLSHNAFNAELSIKLLIYPSQAGFWGRKASDKKRLGDVKNGRTERT